MTCSPSARLAVRAGHQVARVPELGGRVRADVVDGRAVVAGAGACGRRRGVARAPGQHEGRESEGEEAHRGHPCPRARQAPTAPSVGDDAVGWIFDARSGAARLFPTRRGGRSARSSVRVRGAGAPARGPRRWATRAPGSHMVIRAPPPGAAPAVTVPACRPTTCWTIARPRPGAGHRARLRRAVEALEHVRQVGRARCPGPGRRRSATPLASRTVIVPPAGPHLAALSSRLVTARSTAPDSPTTHQGRVTTSNSLRGARSRTRRDGPVDDLGEVEGLHDLGQRLVAGELDQVADEVDSSSIWARTSSSSSALLLGREPAGRRRPG